MADVMADIAYVLTVFVLELILAFSLLFLLASNAGLIDIDRAARWLARSSRWLWNKIKGTDE